MLASAAGRMILAILVIGALCFIAAKISVRKKKDDA